MAKENTSVYIILGLLNHEDLSGYDIKKRADFMISSFWEIGYGQIYPTLSKLEQEGLVTKRVSEETKGPERNLYSITEAGREVLIQWLKLPEQKEYTKYEILLKLFFGQLVPREDSAKRIDAFKARHTENLKMIEMFKGNLERVLGKEQDHLFFYITVLFGERIYKAYLDWADEALKLLGDAGEQSGE
ncbi:PadR family transcriptional regulator [Gorillibacterium massiliense]|uniref:PadR family transcriptional regulator n=1 Tax=Gorillibacterium massiliense TaxID=1280390 RepID=UPI0004BB53C1|nr:PadR family transcriptional regulator [Gorillibacterium massiliense]